jgi:hypothetical protein
MSALHGIRASAALDQLARDLYVNHQEYLGLPIICWPDVPFNLRQVYLELSARTLRMMCEPSAGTTTDALFHLANALGRAEVTYGLGPTRDDKIIGRIRPHGAA